MNKNRREINVFNLSFLDVLSCGLGAVLTLLLVSFRNASSHTEEKRRLTETRVRMEQARKEREEADRRIEELKQLLERLEQDRTKHEIAISTIKRELERLMTFHFTGIQTRKKNILILLDLSGSMEPCKERLSEVAKGLVDTLPGEESRFNIMGFGVESRDERILFWMPAGQLVDATLESRKKAGEWISRTVADRVSKSNSTPLEEALARALGWRDVEAVFLVTDGAPDEVGDTDAFIERIRSRNLRHVEIHCIGIGDALYRRPMLRNFLRKLADAGGGGFAAF